MKRSNQSQTRRNSERDGWQFYRLLGNGQTWLNEVLQGALQVAFERGGPEAVDVEGCDRIDMLSYQGCLGIIAPIWSERMRELLRHDFPVLNVSNLHGPVEGCGNVLSDDAAVGRLAARYLRERGYRDFLVVAQHRGAVQLERADAFEQELRKEGFRVRRFAHDFTSKSEGGWSQPHFLTEIGEVVRPVLEGMELNTGIFATNDWLANILLKTLDAYFPEHLSTAGVLGVDNQQANWYPGKLPGLSSIQPGFMRMGRTAMEWLYEHPGSGRKAAEELNLRVPPVRVVSRASTACGGCADPLTARMIRWAWERVQREEEISVAEMARVHQMSAKTLERRFAEHAGTTAVALVARLKLDLARHLLRETETPITEISERCGFSKHDVLSRALLKAEGCTPSEFRRLHRVRSEQPDSKDRGDHRGY